MRLKEMLPSGSTMQDASPTNTLARCFNFLCLGDLLRCRAASRSLQQFVKSHFIPHSSPDCLFFVTPRFRARERSHSSSVRCRQCDQPLSVFTKTCPQCDVKVSTDQKGKHLFVGQLSIHRTAQLAGWLLRMLWPSIEILRIDVHTSRGGQSRGCAWVYVGNSADERRVLSLDRRVFLDFPRDKTREGFWLVSRLPQAMEELKIYALKTKVTRPGLPSKPLVVERPAGTGKNRQSIANASQLAPGGEYPLEAPKDDLLSSLPQRPVMTPLTHAMPSSLPERQLVPTSMLTMPQRQQQQQQRFPIVIPTPRNHFEFTGPPAGMNSSNVSPLDKLHAGYAAQESQQSFQQHRDVLSQYFTSPREETLISQTPQRHVRVGEQSIGPHRPPLQSQNAPLSFSSRADPVGTATGFNVPGRETFVRRDPVDPGSFLTGSTPTALRRPRHQRPSRVIVNIDPDAPHRSSYIAEVPWTAPNVDSPSTEEKLVSRHQHGPDPLEEQ